jgi:peptidoglycan/xylan/chitin deacetylase (PgdA/CDA1 family)
MAAELLRAGIKAVLAGAFHSSGALALVAGARRVLDGPRVVVLGFHRVVDRLADVPPEVIPSLCITTGSFRRLCELAARRCEVLPLLEAAAVLAGARRARRDVVALTFDDGYRDVYLRALPVLRALGLPATVFVPTGYIGSPQPLLHDRLHALLVHARAARRDLAAAPGPRLLCPALAHAGALLHAHGRRGPAVALDALIDSLPAQALARVADAVEDLVGGSPPLDEGARVMSAAELRACVEGGVDLGAHTIDHVVLTREPPARVRRELRRPREELEAIASRPCLSFAYCNGLWSPPVVEALREAGYAVAVTTCDRPNRPGQEPLLLGRKVLWEGHARGPLGRFSTALAAAHVHDLFGDLGLTSPVDGQHHHAAAAAERTPWRRSA